MGNWHILAVSISIIFFLSFITNLKDAASFEISFPSNSFRLDGPPTYCGIDISDSVAPDYNRQYWINLAEDAIREWKNKLQSVETVNTAVWEMNYLRVSTQEEYIASDCNIPIIFKPYTDDTEQLYKRAGQFSWPPSIIEIFYLQPTYCPTSNNDLELCYDTELFNSDDIIFKTILHEIGHSLSLDHYVSDDNEVNKKWYTEDPAPSVMIPTLHGDPSLQQITNIDIQKVRSIYGANGFYAFSSIPVPSPPFIPTPPSPVPPIPEPQVPLVPILPFDTIKVSHNVVEVEPYMQQTIKIIGDISEDVFHRGIPVYLVVFKPDQTTEVLKIPPTREGHFETILIFNNDSQRGIYYVEAYYLDNHDKDTDVTFEVISRGDSPTEVTSPQKALVPDKPKKMEQNTIVKVPEWIKSNARWWAEGTISDREFSLGIQHLMKEGIIKIPETERKTSSVSDEIPYWVRSNAEWWSKGLISTDDFVRGLQYLIEKGIIRIS